MSERDRLAIMFGIGLGILLMTFLVVILEELAR